MARPVKTPFTTQELELIEQLAGYGLKVEQIAHVLKLPKRTFDVRLSYTDKGRACSLEKGRARAAAKVTQTLYQMATSGKQPASTFFWLKTRLGWRDTIYVQAEQTLTDGNKKKAVEEKRLANQARLDGIKNRNFN